MQRPAVVEPGLTAALDDEAAAGKSPGADRRAPGAADGARQRRRIGVDAVQLGERARDRQRELRARAETGVRAAARDARRCGRRRGCRGGRGSVCANAAARAASSPCALTVSAGRREQQRRRRRRGADAAEPAAQLAAQIEHAEMQARRRFDEDSVPASARRAAALRSIGSERPRVRGRRCGCNRVSSAIASSSRGPAVLSTMTCSRSSSLSMKSRGSRCRRVA